VRPWLALYRELGGEILTVGSDAHVPENVGQGVPEAYDLIRAAGFRYIAVYEGRKPRFVKM
jgi:histidinol-phosphatase (PHP family)